MIRFTPVLIAALSIFTLLLPATSYADEDGFLVFEVIDVTPAETVPSSAVTQRKERTNRQPRNQRSSRLKNAKYYKVLRGDTLYRISIKSGVKLSRLVKLNNLHGSKKHKIQAGQNIRLR